MSMARPDLYDVLQALADSECSTLQLRHRLVEKFEFPTSLPTGLVLRRLKRLEQIGRVGRAQTVSRRDYAWVAIKPPHPIPAPEPIKGKL